MTTTYPLDGRTEANRSIALRGTMPETWAAHGTLSVEMDKDMEKMWLYAFVA